MPLRVKLAAALFALGLDPKTTEFDHDPALGLRPVDPETGDTVPAANDPKHIVPRARAAHRHKTVGDHRPLSGDISRIAKLKDVERKEAAFRQRLLAKTAGERAPKPKRRSRPIPARPFQKRTRKDA